MQRVVNRIDRGKSAGKFKACVRYLGSVINVGGTFMTEEAAMLYLTSQTDEQLTKIFGKNRRNVKFDIETWKQESKTQIKELSLKYMFMKSNLSSVEAAAIQRYCTENNAVPQLSIFPTIRFKIKETGKIVEQNLRVLVSNHLSAKEEEKNMRANEKRRKANEDKWKPRLAE